MTDSFCDDFSQALVCVWDSQIPFQVSNSQPTYESKVTPLPVSDLMAQVAAEVAARLATTKKNKNRREAGRALKNGQERNATMKWLPFMSSFVLEKMCGLIQSGVRTDKGFKEVHLNSVAKGLAEHCGVSVCSTQVYNHRRKWRQRWLTISTLRDLSGAQWCEDTKCIVLEGEHYCEHVADHPNDAEFLNVPIANYNEMHTIFPFGLTTGEYAMGSSEPLGSAAANLAPEDAETQESDTVNLDADKHDTLEKPIAGKRKRGAFADDELVAFTNMIVAVKDVAQAIRDNKPTDMHPDLYNAVMDMLGFAEDDLMAALSHPVDHKAQGSSFVMIEPHRVLWLRNYLGKYHDKVNGYSNNSYRGYATLEEAQQEYLTFLEEELLEDQAIDDAVPLAQLPPEEVHALQGEPSEVRPNRVKDYIIGFLIVRIVFF
ncbi:hypothetical protein QYE76_001448 [Lolium multiflorum]|uniref:Myb/SANT-like domain-containing protein n=1 Tax=Lolium multiflorum TaxID=4521 RepID=A0AAD8RJU5_LOLMU|nr:hypothetical protein QYE76_001448 [Lolium multiflorum]